MIHIYLQLPDDTYFSDPLSYTWGPDTKRLEKCIGVYQGEKNHDRAWSRAGRSFAAPLPLLLKIPLKHGVAAACFLFYMPLVARARAHTYALYFHSNDVPFVCGARHITLIKRCSICSGARARELHGSTLARSQSA